MTKGRSSSSSKYSTPPKGKDTLAWTFGFRISNQTNEETKEESAIDDKKQCTEPYGWNWKKKKKFSLDLCVQHPSVLKQSKRTLLSSPNCPLVSVCPFRPIIPLSFLPPKILSRPGGLTEGREDWRHYCPSEKKIFLLPSFWRIWSIRARERRARIEWTGRKGTAANEAFQAHVRRIDVDVDVDSQWTLKSKEGKRMSEQNEMVRWRIRGAQCKRESPKFVFVVPHSVDGLEFLSTGMENDKYWINNTSGCSHFSLFLHSISTLSALYLK